jgi:phosphatidylinositol glycan class V
MCTPSLDAGFLFICTSKRLPIKWDSPKWFYYLGTNFRAISSSSNGQYDLPICFISSLYCIIQIKTTSLIKCIFLVALVISPFVAYQFAAYLAFCSDVSSTQVKWCDNFPPSIYTHVQSTYWNVGLLRYWNMAQAPNFLIASPPIIVILTFAFHHLSSVLSEMKLKTVKPGFRYSLSLTPHAIHAVVFTFILLFASHTQIVLRVAASMPFTYWAAAWVCVKYPTYGAAWVTWSVLWGLISVILWGTFLPPA